MCKDIDVLPSALFNAKFVIRADLQKKIQFRGCQSALSSDLGAWEPGKNLCAFEGDTSIWRKMACRVWCWWERGRADSYPKSFSCRSTAQTHSHGQQMWCAGMRVTPCQPGHQKSVCQQKNIISYRNVWLPLGVECSLHHWKHLPALGWFQYRTAAATSFLQVIQNVIRI